MNTLSFDSHRKAQEAAAELERQEREQARLILTLVPLDSPEGAELMAECQGVDYQLDSLSQGHDMRLHDIVVVLEGTGDLVISVTYNHGVTHETMIMRGMLHEVRGVLERARYRTFHAEPTISVDTYCGDCGKRQPDESAPYCYDCGAEVQ